VRIRFWGVRGSSPQAAAGSSGADGRSPCVEVTEPQTGAYLILDAGSGIVALGETLAGPPRAVPILLTHYHPGHVQGLPLFAPLHQPGWSASIWGPTLEDVEPRWEGVFDDPCSVDPHDRLLSPPALNPVMEGPIEIGGFRITAHPITHPGGAFAYRVHGADGDLVYVTDHEFGVRDTDERLAALVLNADAVILDAQFTPEELTARKGQGHASWRQAAEFASATGAGHLWLFHHRPGREHAELAELTRRARRVFPATSVALEGVEFEV
jgi:phosphoribosyl 1,2-cyclic phosphodiesterase